jgi:hypothetical protein
MGKPELVLCRLCKAKGQRFEYMILDRKYFDQTYVSCDTEYCNRLSIQHVKVCLNIGSSNWLAVLKGLVSLLWQIVINNHKFSRKKPLYKRINQQQDASHKTRGQPIFEEFLLCFSLFISMSTLTWTITSNNKMSFYVLA